MDWNIEPFNGAEKLKTKNAILIEGLPGIGNVGKIAVDFMIEEMKAKKVYSVFSHSLPHSVFVNEENLLELPMIEIYYKRINGRDVFFLSGDVQPMDEVSCYKFCEAMLTLLEKHKGSEVITTGGIGLNEIPETPKVYCTSTKKEIVDYYKKSSNVESKLYGVVGPIIGVSGVMVGLAHKRNIAGACLLVETYGHPMYIGLNGAKEMVRVLSKKLGVKLDSKKIDKGMKDVNSAFVKASELGKLNKDLALKQSKNVKQDVNYIG